MVRIPEFLGKKVQPHVRRAQSIITRSEAELFGISAPRYATRLYLKNGGFINCRRLEQFIANAPGKTPKEWGSRYPDDKIDKENRNQDLKPIQHPICSMIGDIVSRQSCVADCLLAEPERLAKYHIRYVGEDSVETARLFDIYTEPKPENFGETPYTPYVKAIDFGGGLCAQAVCFMATTNLSKYATSLCGLSEITAYAHPNECLELSLSGLTPAKMQRYFNRVELNLSEQIPDQGLRAELTKHQKQELATALRCYLRSQMPVIFPVDCRKMASLPVSSKSIYTNNAKVVSPSSFPQDAAHAIILVGYSHPKDLFVFHDPFAFPYMMAEISELAVVGCRRGVADQRSQDNGVFMPVTPLPVRLPLMWERQQDPITGHLQDCAGLFTISKALHTLLHNLTHPTAFSFAAKAPFLLSTTPPTVDDLDDVPQEGRLVLLREVEECVHKSHQSLGWKSPRWLWYELHPDCVWIWDAELPVAPGLPSDVLQCLSYLVGVARLKYTKEGQVSSESVSVTIDS